MNLRWILWSASLWFCLSAAVKATEPITETREFSVKVDGKTAGAHRMTIRQEGDTFTVNSQADVQVRVLLYQYVYSYRGTEVWKAGRLQRLESTTVDDKKRHAVTALAEPNGLRVKADGMERTTRPDVWTSTYWRLPDRRYRNQAVPLIDADTGQDLRATLQGLGTSTIQVGGQIMSCSHYRVVGSVHVDLWYDSQERLVRMETVEDGHRTVVELVKQGR